MEKMSLISHLDDLYSKNLKGQKEFQDQDDFFDWTIEKRKELIELLGVDDLRTEKIEKTDTLSSPIGENYDIEILNFYLDDGTIMPVYIGKLKNLKPPYRPIIIHHGHADGAKVLFGVGMTKEYQDYALEFLKKGYLVVAADHRGFAKRLGPSPIFYNGYTRSCRQVAFDLLMLGKTLLGERVADAKVLVDYLISRDDILEDKIVVTGNSGGGTISLLHAAIDLRVPTAIISSAFCEFKHSIMEISHCECNYIPGILKLFKEIWEIGALLAPRPVLIIHGKEDEIFPVEYVKSAYKKMENYYQLNNVISSLDLHIHPGGHRYDHSQVFDFLDQKIYL